MVEEESVQGNNYQVAEDLNFLSRMKKVLPIADKGWNIVAMGHNHQNPDSNWVDKRNKESISPHFHTLYQMHVPAGEPHCLQNVFLAKQIKSKIFQWNHASTGLSYLFSSCYSFIFSFKQITNKKMPTRTHNNHIIIKK